MLAVVRLPSQRLRLQFSPRHVRFGVYMRISVESLSKRYGGVRALDSVTFTIEPGQILAVLGVNGAGKTTLLRCFSGVVTGSGSILYDGERFTRGSMNLRRRIAFLPDFPIAFPHHTLLRHIGMVLRLYESDDPAVEARVLELLRGFDLLPLGRHTDVQTLTRSSVQGRTGSSFSG